MTRAGGGKREGSGRKSGEAWASKRAPAQRKLAQVSRARILQNRDPLAELVRLGFEAGEEEVRVKALAASLPFIYPRLSMSVVADATPQQAERITSEMLHRELLDRIARLPSPVVEIEHETVVTKQDTDRQSEDKG